MSGKGKVRMISLGVLIVLSGNACAKQYKLTFTDDGVPIRDCLVSISVLYGKAILWEEKHEFKSLFTDSKGEVFFNAKGRRISVRIFYDRKLFKVYDGKMRGLGKMKYPIDVSQYKPHGLLNSVDPKFDSKYYSKEALDWLIKQRNQSDLLIIPVKYPDGTPATKILYRIISRKRSALFVEFQTSAHGYISAFVPKNDTFDVEILPKQTKWPENRLGGNSSQLQYYENVRLENVRPGPDKKPITTVVLERIP